MTPEDEPARSEGVQYPTGEEKRANTNSQNKNEAAGTKQEQFSAVDACLLMEVKSDAIKNNTV